MKINDFMKLTDREKEKFNLHTEDGNDFDIQIFYHWNLKASWDMKCEVCTEDQNHYLLIGTGDTREPKFCLEHYAEINQDAEFRRILPKPEMLNHLVTFRFTSGEWSQIFYKVFNATRARLEDEVKEYMRTYYGEPEDSDADENCGNGWCYYGCQVALAHERTEVIKSYEWLLKELTAESATINKEDV